DLQRPGSENASVADQEIEAIVAHRVRHTAGPGLHGMLLGDVADGQIDAPSGSILQILDLRCGYGCAEDGIALGGEPECDITTEPAACAGNCSGSAGMLGCR